ncbi:MAG: extracellular solute-binding protein [Ruminococcaceae bacterium]|nr:extracellular solute-binding protein [Oscillospiraceae bacterium]
MNKKLRIVCLVLAVLMLFVSCNGKNGATTSSDIIGGNTNNSSSSTDNATSSDSTSDETPSGETPNITPDAGNEGVETERKLVGNAYTSGFPIVKDKIELTVMAEKTSMHGEFDTMAFSKEYEKKTNIKINWELFSTSDRNNKASLALMSGNPPDVMCMIDGLSATDIITYGGQDMLVPIEDMLSQWAPNVKLALEQNSVAKKSVTTPDGHIYSVPLIHSVDDHTIFPEKMYINKTWLENLVLPMPTTYSELLNVLRQFKNGDPNGNGQKDEIPIATSLFNVMLAGAPQGLAWDWTTDRMYVDSNNKIGYFMATEAYRDSIKFYKTLYSEGLCDKNVLEGKATVAGKARTGKVGVFTAVAGTTTLSEKELKNYTMLPALKSTADSKQTVWARQREKIYPFAFVITASALKDKNKSKVEAALRWVDYFFTTEGYVFEQYGSASSGFYKKLSNGKLEILPKKTDSDRYKIAPGYVLPSWYTLAAKNVWAEKDASKMTEADKFFRDIDEGMSNSLYRPLIQSKFIPHLFFTKVQSAKLNTLADPIHSYAYNTGLAFVKGDMNIDTGWNDYLAELKRLGVEEFVSIYQSAYNSYNG